MYFVTLFYLELFVDECFFRLLLIYGLHVPMFLLIQHYITTTVPRSI